MVQGHILTLQQKFDLEKHDFESFPNIVLYGHFIAYVF